MEPDDVITDPMPTEEELRVLQRLADKYGVDNSCFSLPDDAYGLDYWIQMRVNGGSPFEQKQQAAEDLSLWVNKYADLSKEELLRRVRTAYESMEWNPPEPVYEIHWPWETTVVPPGEWEDGREVQPDVVTGGER